MLKDSFLNRLSNLFLIIICCSRGRIQKTDCLLMTLQSETAYYRGVRFSRDVLITLKASLRRRASFDPCLFEFIRDFVGFGFLVPRPQFQHNLLL